MISNESTLDALALELLDESDSESGKSLDDGMVTPAWKRIAVRVVGAAAVKEGEDEGKSPRD